MNNKDLDRHITGNYGEDSVGEDSFIKWHVDGNMYVPIVTIDGCEVGGVEELFEMYMQSQAAIKRLNEKVHRLEVENRKLKDGKVNTQILKLIDSEKSIEDKNTRWFMQTNLSGDELEIYLNENKHIHGHVYIRDDDRGVFWIDSIPEVDDEIA